MRKLLLAALATVGLVIGTASQASAAWVTRTVERFDPRCGHVVAVPERVWVPDRVGHYHRGSHYGPRHNHRGYAPNRGVFFNFGVQTPFRQ